jgi:hypothetical protein
MRSVPITPVRTPSSAAAPEPVAANALTAPGGDAQGAFTTLLATGAKPFEAILALKKLPRREVLAFWREWMGPRMEIGDFNDLAWELVCADPPFGSALLKALPVGFTAFRGPVAASPDSIFLPNTDLAALPQGLTVEGSLVVQDNRKLALLPDDLTVTDDLNATDCALTAVGRNLKVQRHLDLEGNGHLVTLGKGLQVADGINLRRCPAWDGRLPVDAQIGGTIYSDRYPRGTWIVTWRTLFPDGECTFVPGPDPWARATALLEHLSWEQALRHIAQGLPTDPVGSMRALSVLAEVATRRPGPDRAAFCVALAAQGIHPLSVAMGTFGAPGKTAASVRGLARRLGVDDGLVQIDGGGNLAAHRWPVGSRWPEGLSIIPGSLYLAGHGRAKTYLKALPEGLTVAGALDLSWSTLPTLPTGLRVQGWINLEGGGWLGEIPEDAHIEGMIYTDATPIRGYGAGYARLASLPKGLTLSQWRHFEALRSALRATGVALPEASRQAAVAAGAFGA